MRTGSKHLSMALLPLAVCVPAFGQSSSLANPWSSPAIAPHFAAPAAADFTAPSALPAVDLLLGFRDSEVKFELSSLMELLRDRRHEGWVLAAYPDPKTGRPLIGAGFSLDLPAREHLQHDPLNPHPFLEPSSAELWQAAGLEPQRLRAILNDYDERLAAWNTRTFRRNIRVLPQQISDEEANLLLRVAAIQAVYNAKAYCRNFDGLTAPQQMALSQLVYQMGVNLEEFSQFLALMNSDAAPISAAGPRLLEVSTTDSSYWRAVQESLEQSQWARLYRSRAVSVIAMLDPDYAGNPVTAERRVSAVLTPAVSRRRHGHVVASRQLASTKRKGNGTSKKASRGRPKRKA